MKLVFLILLVFVLDVYAGEYVTFESYADAFAPGETYQIEYDLNLDVVQLETYLILPNGERYEPGLISTMLGNKNYLYFNIPDSFSVGNYSFVAKGKFLDNNFLREFLEEEMFTIKKTEGVRIETPLIKLNSAKDFRVRLYNTGENKISLKPIKNNFSVPFRESLMLERGERKDMLFKVIDNNFDVDYLLIDSDIKTYRIPVVGVPKIKTEIIEQKENKTPYKEEEPIVFLNKNNKINVILKEKESKEGYVRFKATKDIEGVEVVFSGDVKEIATANVSLVGNMKKDQVYSFEVFINKELNGVPGDYTGFLNLLYEGGSVEMEAKVEIILESVEVQEEKKALPIIQETKKIENEKEQGVIQGVIDVRYLIVAFLVICLIVYVFYNISKPRKPKNSREIYSKFRK